MSSDTLLIHLQTFILPSLLLLGFFTPRPSISSLFTSLILVAAIGVQLWGTPTSGMAITLSLMRVGAETAKWELLRRSAEEGEAEAVLLESSIVSSRGMGDYRQLTETLYSMPLSYRPPSTRG